MFYLNPVGDDETIRAPVKIGDEEMVNHLRAVSVILAVHELWQSEDAEDDAVQDLLFWVDQIQSRMSEDVANDELTENELIGLLETLDAPLKLTPDEIPEAPFNGYVPTTRGSHANHLYIGLWKFVHPGDDCYSFGDAHDIALFLNAICLSTAFEALSDTDQAVLKMFRDTFNAAARQVAVVIISRGVYEISY